MDLKDKIGLVATDLDGTLLRHDHSISPTDWEMLEFLGANGILRVVATGRNFRKVKEVIPDHAPFDFVAFSSGAGIYDCRNNELIYKQNISVETTNAIVRKLVANKLNFYLFKGIPQNSYCWYYRGEAPCDEFERYYSYHRDYADLLPANGVVDRESCQFLVMFREADDFEQLKSVIEDEFEQVKVVRASSPLHTGYIWMEIFHKDVSKGNAIKYLCDANQVPHHLTYGIGNDYNDLELLEFTSISYLVENSPSELKSRYLSAPSNEDNGFSASIRNHLFD